MTTAPSVLGRADGADRPTDLVAAARELQPLLRENSPANEAAGQLTDVVVGEGYRLSGAWSFASGIKHAQWIHTLGVVEGAASR